jgi:hypothetical protein
MIQKKVLGMMALAVVLAIMMFTGVSYAVSEETGGQETLGSSLIFQYYDIRTTAQGGPGLSDNYFTVVNADDVEFTNAHVRVRTGQCSVELLDFDVILSPHDVFAFDLYQTATGSTQFASCDTDTLVASGFNVDSNGCYVLDSSTFPDMLSLIETCGNCPDGSGAPLSDADALAATRWGYVEVIGEVELEPADANYSDATECTSDQLKAGEYTAWSFVEAYHTSGNDCYDWADYSSVDEQLFGRVYYARFDAERNLVRLATTNGVSLDDNVCGGDVTPNPTYDNNCSWMVIHRPCYSDTSPGCAPGDGELENSNPFVAGDAKYAYAAASTDMNPAGADDMNYCFYKNTITTLGDVVNKVGAGATFGPTLADLDACSAPRDGGAVTTEDIVRWAEDYYDKDGAVSHYFYIPGQGQTRYVFTFPFQHFLGESVTITKEARFNNEEETCAIPTGKFISPGLPVAGLPRGEVTILETQASGDPCSFNEGWLAFDLWVTSDSAGGSDYPPGVLGMVVNYGDGDNADVMATAPMQWTWGLDWMLNEQ